MNLNEYQNAALTTAVYPRQMGLLYTALKLAGEAGEVADKVGKAIRDESFMVAYDTIKAPRRQELIRELGDVLWYVAAMAWELGCELEEIAEANLDKLGDRQARGVLSGSGDDR